MHAEVAGIVDWHLDQIWVVALVDQLGLIALVGQAQLIDEGIGAADGDLAVNSRERAEILDRGLCPDALVVGGL